ncbi:DNA-binding protein WhiA [Iocasia frigidifontis]|uniref:Probable cell division protein WhiA n=1 Tax=Iocasia fonsfrigidae TaxID=2682810 RepID=A0A8A7K798_9FIRM|nr:DNA-binding protein WhiA [Iocasia fonsfrigidae]QTL97050.1 DNA-binding protein WhiA [Iocasia fonsfrigidae]
MSFSDEVKHEIARIKSRELPELAALIRMDGSIQIINKQLALKVKIYHGDLARKVYSLIKSRYGLKIGIMVRKGRHFSYKNNTYLLRLPPQEGLKHFLYELGFIDENNTLIYKIKEEFINDLECQKAYLRGAFLGGGSVNKPNSEYHLEFRCEHENFAEELLDLLARLDLKGYLTEHNGKYIVYFKKSEDIATILNIIGAHQALLKMENQRVFKAVKNNVNRKINFETANLDKTVIAAMLQLEDIELIENTKGLSSLSKGLQEIALLRKQYPYASLKELGEQLEPRLSKSGVNHRMRRIKKVAKEIRGDD